MGERTCAFLEYPWISEKNMTSSCMFSRSNWNVERSERTSTAGAASSRGIVLLGGAAARLDGHLQGAVTRGTLCGLQQQVAQGGLHRGAFPAEQRGQVGHHRLAEVSGQPPEDLDDRLVGSGCNEVTQNLGGVVVSHFPQHEGGRQAAGLVLSPQDAEEELRRAVAVGHQPAGDAAVEDGQGSGASPLVAREGGFLEAFRDIHEDLVPEVRDEGVADFAGAGQGEPGQEGLRKVAAG